MDGPDLSPARPKRARKAPAQVAPAAVADAAVPAALAARVGAMESALRTLDVRLEAIERLTRKGIEDLTAALAAGLAEQDLSELRSDLRLVAERLSTLLGGPTLTEIMDRVDALDRPKVTEEPPKRRRRSVNPGGQRAGTE